MTAAKTSDDLMVDAIRRFTDTWGFPPTIREIGHLVGLDSPATVSRRLNRLRRQGRITWTDGRVRTIRVVE